MSRLLLFVHYERHDGHSDFTEVVIDEAPTKPTLAEVNEMRRMAKAPIPDCRRVSILGWKELADDRPIGVVEEGTAMPDVVELPIEGKVS